MPDRTVSVSLRANVGQYLAGMDAAAARTAKFSASSTARLAEQRAAFGELGRGAVIVGALAAAAVGLAIKAYADYEKQLGELEAVTNASTADMEKLSVAALHAGQQFGFVASEVVDAEINLSRAGLTTNQILAALPGTLSLAAAAGLSVADASKIAGQAMVEFGLGAKDAAHIADIFANADDKSLISTQDLAEGMSKVAPVARSFGISIDETAGTLTAFAAAGLTGSDGATALRQTLLKLQNPTGEASKALYDLGINTFDASGKFVGMESLAGQLHDKLGSLTVQQQKQALATIFGSRATVGATTLLALGAQGISDYTKKVTESGAAQKDAATKMDNLAGDAKKLAAAFNTDLIESGSGANDMLRGLVQGLTGLVQVVGEAPKPVLETGTALLGLVAITGLVGGGALLGVPKVVAFKAALTTLGVSGKSAAVGIGLAGVAITAAVVILAAFAAAQADASASSDAFRDSLDQSTGATTKYTRELVAKRLQEKGAFGDIKDLKVSQEELTNAVAEGGPAYDALVEKLTNTRNGLGLTTSNAGDLLGVLSQVNGEVATGKDRFSDLNAASGNSADKLAELGGAAVSAGTDIDELAKAITGFGSAQLDVNDAERKFQAAIDDATASAKEHGATLDINTEAGRANSSALDDIATSALAASSAILTQTGSVDDATGAVQAGRDAFIAAAAQYGLTGDAAEAYADSVGLIPANVSTAVKLTGINTALQALQTLYTQSVRLAKVPHYEGSVLVSANENGGMYQAFANGGMPTGIYPGRPGGLYKFAEQGVGWEAFISGKPGQEARNRGIWAEAGNRLGVQAPQGPVTALVDPAFVRAVRQLASAHQATLNTVGLATAAGQGTALQTAGGAR